MARKDTLQSARGLTRPPSARLALQVAVSWYRASTACRPAVSSGEEL